MLEKTKGELMIALNNLSRDARKLIDEDIMKVEDMIAKLPTIKAVDQETFVEAYTRLHSNARGETFESNAIRLLEWLTNEGYIIPKEE